ncbi:MAG TPA: R3H domain-containing nucleic acid-binding protein [Candidatus Limnocylindrales bacterium]|nr:R3H domain-containing nucleic acid-binding protein [Candidatus Limnocylindrales bacterium]
MTGRLRPEPGERRETSDDLEALLSALPPDIQAAVRALPADGDLIEVVMDLGRQPEARFGGGGEAVLLEREVNEDDLQYVVDHIGSFGDDNRAGIERTLHRISAIRNRNGKIVGLTCRIGRAVFGTIEIAADLVESGRSILIMGRPGVGKTTMLREAARVLADDLGKRVVVVDTSNEIAGDGDIPHPGIGRARRMQVPTPALQHDVMIEAVENHMPEVIVIDEIGTELEAGAARTIAERGVQLIGTAHGNSLDNLMLNPTLSDLIGGIQSVTLGDEEARRRRSQKSVLERKAPPTFDVVVEIQDRDRVAVHADVAETVDALLRGDALPPELRWRDEGGVHRTQARPRPSLNPVLPGERFGPGLTGSAGPGWRAEPGWQPSYVRADTPWLGADRRPAAYRPGGGGSGGWRVQRRRSGAGSSANPEGGPPEGSGRAPAGLGVVPPALAAPTPGEMPFRSGDLADRGPLERGSVAATEPRAREARELERQREWRASAGRAIQTLQEQDEAAVDEAADDDDGAEADDGVEGAAEAAAGAGTEAEAHAGLAAGTPEGGGRGVAEAQDVEGPFDPLGALAPDGYATALPTVRVLAFGLSRKRLEQAIRELQLPVVVVRDVSEADVVLTLRTYYRQKVPALREAEERGLPVYVLKSNTIPQMQACLTSLYALEADPREAALQETAEAIGLVRREAKPVELSPQGAYIRRLQHQMAERANLVSRSRGREPYRRVRLYPDQARAWR